MVGDQQPLPARVALSLDLVCSDRCNVLNPSTVLCISRSSLTAYAAQQESLSLGAIALLNGWCKFLRHAARTQNDLASNYSHTLESCGQAGQMFGVRLHCTGPRQPCAAQTAHAHLGCHDFRPAPERRKCIVILAHPPRSPAPAQDSMQRLARKTDPRTETLWCAAAYCPTAVRA